MAAQNKLKHYKPLQVLAGSSAFAITPNDGAELDFVTSKLWVGSAGDVEIVLADDSVAVILVGVPAGTMLDLRIKQVKAAGTTAGDLVGII
jgi:hypothetical protein